MAEQRLPAHSPAPIAPTLVDCTGDGDVAALAGAPFQVGREDDGLVQPLTLMFRVAEFQRQASTSIRANIPTSGAACTACGI